MLKAALCGGYVNFGVFSLYGDDTLEKALKTFVELLSSIPHSNLLVRRGPPMSHPAHHVPRFTFRKMIFSNNRHNKRWTHWFKIWLFVNVSILFILVQEYPKLSQSYYALLEILAQDHMNFLSSLEPRVSIRKKHVFLWESKVCRVKTAINKWNQSKESFINLIV